MQINPNNVVPVYSRLDDQLRFRTGCEDCPFGLLSRQDRIPPFQFRLPGNRTAATVTTHRLGGQQTAPAGGVFQLDRTADHTYFTWKGTQSWSSVNGGGAFCGFFFLEIVIDDLFTYYTEVFHLVDFQEEENIYELLFWDNTDGNGILWQNGYKQKVLFEGYFADNRIEEESDTTLNGRNEAFLNFLSVKERYVLEWKDFPDCYKLPLSQLKHYDNKALYELAGLNLQPPLQEVEFQTRPQDDCLSIGVLSWMFAHYTKSGCEENEVLL